LRFYKGNSIGKSFVQRYKKTKLWVKALPVGYGNMAPAKLRQVLDAFGVQDVAMGWIGSENIHTRYRAIFKGFRDNTESIDDVARGLGKKLFHRTGSFYKKRE